MTPEPDPNRRDPLDGYADGAPDAVHAARPDEPTDAQWDALRHCIHDRLNPGRAPTLRRWRAAVWVAAGAALSAAAAVAWFAFAPAPAQKVEVAETRKAPVAPPDPLAEFDVLPMATADEVEFRRVPGSGWFPVGADPLPGELALATHDEVELDDPDSVWPQVTPSPGDAPMIYAAKPR